MVINSTYIIRYLDEFMNIIAKRFDSETEIGSRIKKLIEFHQEEPNVTYYSKIKDETKKGNQMFSLASVMYLLEQRRVVISSGSIWLTSKSGTISLRSQGALNLLTTEFGLTNSEGVTLINNVIGALESLTKHVDLETGDMIITKIPKSYNKNMVCFEDVMIDLSNLKPTKIDLEVIPSVQLHTKFYEYDIIGVQRLKELLLFIADYNPEEYKRMLKILAYSYTHSELEKMFLMLGKGRNGKGVFLQFVSKYCMQRAYSMSSMHKMRKSSSSSKESEMIEILTAQATLVEEELEFTKSLFDECYKNLVSGGSETGRKLGNNATTIPNNSVFYVATNYSDFSDIQSDDYAFLDRVITTDFNNKFVTKEDRKLVSEVLNTKNKHFHFKNILTLLVLELGKEESLTFIETQRSTYAKNSTFGKASDDLESVLATVKEYNHLLIHESGSVNMTILSNLVNRSTETLFDIFSEYNPEEVSFEDSVYANFEPSILRRYFTLNATPDDFWWSSMLDLSKLDGVATDERVTKVMYDLNLAFVSKTEAVEFFNCLPGATVKFRDEQPFVTYVKPAPPEPSEEVIVEVEPDAVPIIPTVDNAIAEVLESMNYQVSVFKQPRYPISGVDERSLLTTDIMSLRSNEVGSKEELIKLFPYDILTRGAESNPSKLLALDFDSCENPIEMDNVVKNFERLGYECFIQESFSSRKCSKCTTKHVKFHVIVYCDSEITSLNYAEVAERFTMLLPYKLDENFRYKTIMNVSHYDWIHIKGKKYIVEVIDSITSPPEANRVIDGRLIVQDRSSYTTLLDYLTFSGHEGASLFYNVLYNNQYGVGNRDDTAYKLMMYLNDSLENYNMRIEVYNEGYDKLINIIANHHVNDTDKYKILEKVMENRIEEIV